MSLVGPNASSRKRSSPFHCPSQRGQYSRSSSRTSLARHTSSVHPEALRVASVASGGASGGRGGNPQGPFPSASSMQSGNPLMEPEAQHSLASQVHRELCQNPGLFFLCQISSVETERDTHT